MNDPVDQRTSEKEVKEPYWVLLTIYPPCKSYLYKTTAEDWDKMTEDERQEELADAAIELGWLGPYEYDETGRTNDD